jgi:hypothetical protein
MLNISYMLKNFDFAFNSISWLLTEQQLTIVGLYFFTVVIIVASFITWNGLLGLVFLWSLIAIHARILMDSDFETSALD